MNRKRQNDFIEMFTIVKRKYFHEFGAKPLWHRRCFCPEGALRPQGASMELKFCENCFKTKPIDEFGLWNSKDLSKGRKTKCKQCCTEVESRRFYEEQLEKNPETYWECDICDHIVNVKRSYCNRCKHPRGAKPQSSLTGLRGNRPSDEPPFG